MASIDANTPLRRRLLWTGALPQAQPSPAYRWYVLFVLSLVTLVAYMDRYVLAVLLVPIKNEIGGSDTAMGLLVGVAFFAVYATAAVPIARLADRTNRRNILAIAVAFWSIATCLCGVAATFMQLVFGRIGVAVGEAAAAPTCMSIIGDLFRPSQRALAAGGLFAGTAVGIAVGAYVGGLLNDYFNWRTAFVAVGLPGLVLALILWLTIYEPARGVQDGGLQPEYENQSFGRSLAHLFGIRTYALLILANATLYFGVQGPMVWMPAFLMRIHDMSSTAMGLSFGLSVGAGIFCANILGGIVGDRMSRFGARWYLRTAAGAALLGAPLLFAFAFAPTRNLAVTMIPIFAFVTALATPPAVAASLSIVPPRMRGLGAAVALFFVNGVGSGIGPLVVGAMTDALTPAFGTQALRHAFFFMPVWLVLSSGLFLVASRSVERDIKAASFAPVALT